MSWENDIAARCKSFESISTQSKAEVGKPLLIRLDGRAFHTYTRGLHRPYDDRLSRCMLDTTRILVEKLQCTVGYTQSDEITLLLWVDPNELSACFPFDGRLQKLCSVFAGLASACFAVRAYHSIPEKQNLIPHFDGRVWSVPTPNDAVEVFRWRCWDAKKNSISMAAQSVFSHKQLLNCDSTVKLEMLRDRGVDWNAYPDFFRVGVFVRRQSQQRLLSETERLALPEKHRPAIDEPVTRNVLIEQAPPERLTWQWLLSGEASP